MNPAGWALGALLIVLGGVVGYLLRRVSVRSTLLQAQEEAAKHQAEAQREAETIRRQAELEAKEETLRVSRELDQEIKERRQELQLQERRSLQREENLEKKLEAVETKERDFEKSARLLSDQESKLEERKKEADHILQEQTRALERVSGLTAAEAKKVLMDQVLEEARHESANLARSQSNHRHRDSAIRSGPRSRKHPVRRQPAKR
jgi:ribonuclease Y